MKTCQCSECGISTSSFVWGLALLVRDGWGLAPATNPAGAAERAWLCTDCAGRAARLERRFNKPLAASPPTHSTASTHSRSRAGSIAPPTDRATLHVPAAPSPRPEEEEVRVARESRPLRVLVVDDHILVLRGMMRLLTGCETTGASSGHEAWTLLRTGRQFDVIVSDVMMSDVSGPELYSRCFGRSPELARRFVFASADPRAARELLEKALAQLGAEHAPPLLSKPTSRSALMSAVSAVAAGAVHQSGTYALRLPDAGILTGQRR